MHIRGVLLMAASALLVSASLGSACTIDADCDDANVCNGTETCVAGACQPGTPLSDGASCSDSSPCNGIEVCLGGTCISGNPLNCSDGDPNTAEWCDPVTGCRYQPLGSFTRCDEPPLAGFLWAMARDRCSCSDQTHVQYVRCVAGSAADANAQGLLGHCREALKRCAARSTCGKTGNFVSCSFTLPGSCDGTVCQDGVTPCTGAQDCPARMRCSLRPSAEACHASGGLPGVGSCCDVVPVR
jgi:hypothetical protein